MQLSGYSCTSRLTPGSLKRLNTDSLCYLSGIAVSMFNEACNLITMAIVCMHALSLSACMLANIHFTNAQAQTHTAREAGQTDLRTMSTGNRSDAVALEML